MSTDLRAMIAITVLNEMFKASFFSICTVDRVAEMLGVRPERDAYRQLRALHCVDWAAMPPELREQVPVLIQEALATAQIPQFQLAKTDEEAPIEAPPVVARPLLTRLFGR